MLAESDNRAHSAPTTSAKCLIVNADDFGQSPGVNRGIITAHRDGIVTSASLMVRWPAVADAAAYARRHPSLSVGLHIDLGEQILRGGEWVPLYSVVPVHEESAVREEISRQLDEFDRLLGRAPTHLDSHQHVHLREPARTILVEIAERLGVPLRNCSREVSYCGSFYGQADDGTTLCDVISVDGLIRTLETLPAGCTELACHPAAECDLQTLYCQERLEELKVLCDERLRTAIATMGFELRSFADLRTITRSRAHDHALGLHFRRSVAGDSRGPGKVKLMEKLLPEHLKDCWESVERREHSHEDYTREYDRAVAEFRQTWTRSLILPAHNDLRESLVSELGSYTQCSDLAEVRRRCEQAVANLKREWENKVFSENRQSIEQFYDESPAMLHELMWWHTLGDDLSPLAYVLALRFAQRHGCKSYLDFGAGVGAGGLLFASHGLQTTLADISSSLLRFSAWRLGLRKLPAQYVDLRSCHLPSESFDFITAMDVFEHLADPVETVEMLWNALKPGGFLYGRISADPDEDRPQHIVYDFEPTFERMRTLGFVRVWRDEWLWGHQVFRKT